MFAVPADLSTCQIVKLCFYISLRLFQWSYWAFNNNYKHLRLWMTHHINGSFRHTALLTWQSCTFVENVNVSSSKCYLPKVREKEIWIEQQRPQDGGGD